MDISMDDIRRLSVVERIEWIGDIWDSIEESAEPLPTSEVQRAELERRLALYLRHPEQTSDGSEVRERLERPSR